MKKRNIAFSVATICAVSAFLLSGCNGGKQIDNNPVEYVKVDEEVHLQDDSKSPSCKLTINYAYLAENSTTDTIAHRINETVQSVALGKEYVQLMPTVAVDSFKNAYISNYRKEVAELYEEDIKNGTPKEELPSWYNYEYSLTTTFADGKEGVTTCTVGKFEYSGGAHPNSWEQWLNFDKKTGKLLPLSEVFMAGSETPMSNLLMNELLKVMAEKFPDEKIESLEGLQNAGILLDTKIYVPENFLLEPDKVSFLYNKYDIAPYAVGEIILSLPYTAVEKYMIQPK